MKSRTPLLIVLAVAVLVPGVAMAAVLGSPDLSTHLADNRVTPGEVTSLGIVVQNSGDLESGSSVNPTLNSQVTTARGLTVDVDSGNAPVSITTGTRAVGTLPEGTTPPIQFAVEVDDDAEPGTYRMPVHLNYEYTSYISEGDGTRETEFGDETQYVTLHVRDEARLEIVDVSSTARVGERGTVNVTVENAGTAVATDADVTVTAANPATTFGGSPTASRYLDRWAPGERKNLSLGLTTAPSADVAPYSFDVQAVYRDPGGRQRQTESASFGVTPLPEQSFAIDGVESTLRVGDDGRLRAELEKTANTTVENVVLEWASQKQNVAPSETEYAVGTLGPGESATVDYGVEVSEGAESGPRQFTFVAAYDDARGDPHRSDPIDVQAPVEPARDEFEVGVENGSLEAGSSGTVTVHLTNAGDETLSDISAQVFASSPISTTDSEAFVQSIEPGETTELTFAVAAGGGALEKAYPLSMDVQYEEPDGDTKISDTYRFAVDVSQPADEGGSVLPLVVGGVVVLALLVAAVRYLR